MSAYSQMREALDPFPSLCEWLVANAAKLGIGEMVPKLRERMDRARAALALPPRNCDVGEVGEQILRYLNYCDEHCPSHGGVCTTKVDCVGGCEIEWGQMPYEEEAK